MIENPKRNIITMRTQQAVELSTPEMETSSESVIGSVVVGGYSDLTGERGVEIRVVVASSVPMKLCSRRPAVEHIPRAAMMSKA